MVKWGRFRMKKGIVFALFVVGVLILAGCVVQQNPENQEEIDLIKELQEIERQLGEADNASGEAGVVGDSEETEPVAMDEIDLDTSTLQRIEVSEIDFVDLQVEAEDADDDTLTYSFSPPLGEDGTWQTNYSDAGEYIVTITASDGENTVEQSVLLVVKKKNVPPIIGNVPARLEADEGDVIQLEPSVNDANKDPITLSYTAPFGEEGNWATDHTSAGEYDVVVTATDGETESAARVTLVVHNVNVPPEITGLEDEIIVNEGETVTLKPVVSDLDNDPVEVSISEPIGDAGVWETSFKDNGVYTVTVAASDGKDTVSKEVQITVNDVNVPPKIVSIRQG